MERSHRGTGRSHGGDGEEPRGHVKLSDPLSWLSRELPAQPEPHLGRRYQACVSGGPGTGFPGSWEPRSRA